MPLTWLKHIKTMRYASKMGSFFPSLQHPKQAPLGTSEMETVGSWWKRLNQEIYWFRCSQHRVPFPNIQKPIRIAHLTDLHVQGQSPWLDSLCQFISTVKADIVVYTGDVIAHGWTHAAVDQLFRHSPKGRLGTFAIMGNWEHWSKAKPDVWRPLLHQYGVQLLVEEHVSFGEFGIVGTDDHLAGTSSPDDWNLPDIPHIALSHSPAFFPTLCRDPIHLVLSGHAHGGQVRVPFLKAVWAPRGTEHYVSGWFQKDHRHLFVSRGLGCSVAPLRFRCPPEMAYIDLIPTRR